MVRTSMSRAILHAGIILLTTHLSAILGYGPEDNSRLRDQRISARVLLEVSAL
jgi:hypothetical protein